MMYPSLQPHLCPLAVNLVHVPRVNDVAVTADDAMNIPVSSMRDAEPGAVAVLSAGIAEDAAHLAVALLPDEGLGDDGLADEAAPAAANIVHAAVATARVNAHIDAAITARNQRQAPRDYLGGSRIGEECARKLVYEVTHTPKDTGRDFTADIP